MAAEQSQELKVILETLPKGWKLKRLGPGRMNWVADLTYRNMQFSLVCDRGYISAHKIVDGKMVKFFKENCLVDQQYVRDPDKTVADLFVKAAGDLEVIVVVDGPSEYAVPEMDDNLVVYHNQKPHGMRAAINQAASIAKGEYLLKLDAHCMFAAGFDEVRRLIREKEAPRPSTRITSLTAEERSTIAEQRQIEPGKLGLSLRGDLDRILLKTLEKDREQRYQSALELAQVVDAQDVGVTEVA